MTLITLAATVTIILFPILLPDSYKGISLALVKADT